MMTAERHIREIAIPAAGELAEKIGLLTAFDELLAGLFHTRA
jgi:hypothetical protein